jgi:hypothetical protein
MAIHVRRKRVPPVWLFILAALMALPRAARARDAVNSHSATAAGGIENHAARSNADAVAVPQKAGLIAPCSYKTAAAEAARLFNVFALPLKRAVPKIQLPQRGAAGLSLPFRESITGPAAGVSLSKGAAFAASMAGKTLSANAPIGGNRSFQAGY